MGDEPGISVQAEFGGSPGPEVCVQSPSPTPTPEPDSYGLGTSGYADSDIQQAYLASPFAPEYWQAPGYGSDADVVADGRPEYYGPLDWLLSSGPSNEPLPVGVQQEPQQFDLLAAPSTSWQPGDSWLNPNFTAYDPMGGREDSDETGSSGDPIERERVSFLGLVSLAEGDTYQPKSAHDLVIGLLRSFGGLGELVAPAAPTGLFPGIPTLESARDIGDPRGGYGNLSKEEMEREETGRFRRDLGPATWQSAY